MAKPSPSSSTRATIEAILNTPQANIVMLACVVALLARLGVDVSGFLGPVSAIAATPAAECPPCPPAASAAKGSVVPAPAPAPSMQERDPDAAPSSLDGAPPEDDTPALSIPPSTG